MSATLRKPFIRERFCGWPRKTSYGKFPKFSRKHHVLPDEAIPPAGTNYWMCDPSDKRNFFMLWVRCTGDDHYVYREWPGSYDIPGHGVPEPWAIPSTRRNGNNDGDPGDGQNTFGLPLLGYKFETARLEGWNDYHDWREDNPNLITPAYANVNPWDEANGSEESVYHRIIDCRAANTHTVEKERYQTLQGDFEEIGLPMSLACGNHHVDGVQAVTDGLNWDEQEAPGYLNRPHLYFAESCKNIQYSVENYMASPDRDKGALMDPLNCLFYYFYEKPIFVQRAEARPRERRSHGKPLRAVPMSQRGMRTGRTKVQVK